MSLSIVRRFGQPKDNDPAGGAGYLTSTIVDNLYHHRWREMNSIPPIVKAGEFVHGANTPRSHLNPHSPPSIPFLNVMNVLVVAEVGHHTSQWPFPAITSIVITGSWKSLSQQCALDSNYPTTDIKTIRIPPPWCRDGIWVLEMGWKALFTDVLGGAEIGCSTLLVPPMWDDTYLSCVMKLDQAQHTGGNVSSRSTRWCYQSVLKTNLYWNLS